MSQTNRLDRLSKCHWCQTHLFLRLISFANLPDENRGGYCGGYCGGRTREGHAYETGTCGGEELTMVWFHGVTQWKREEGGRRYGADKGSLQGGAESVDTKKPGANGAGLCIA